MLPMRAEAGWIIVVMETRKVPSRMDNVVRILEKEKDITIWDACSRSKLSRDGTRWLLDCCQNTRRTGVFIGSRRSTLFL